MKKTVLIIMAIILCFAGCAEEKFIPERGNIENGIYNNSAFKISFNGEGWSYSSEEEIAELMGITAEELLSDEYAAALADAETIYDMNAISQNGEVSISINHENTKLIYAGEMNPEIYLELASEKIVEAFESSGISVTKTEIGNKNLGKSEEICLSLEVDLSGITLYERLYAKETNGWISVVTIASANETEISSVAEKVSFN